MAFVANRRGRGEKSQKETIFLLKLSSQEVSPLLLQLPLQLGIDLRIHPLNYSLRSKTVGKLDADGKEYNTSMGDFNCNMLPTSL